MSVLKSRIVYGVEVSLDGREVDYDIANGLYPIAQEHGLDTLWGGRDGHPPTTVVVGVMLGYYSEEDSENTVNLKELLEKEEKVKADFPEEKVLDAIHDYLHVELKMSVDDAYIGDANTVILHILV